MFGSLVIVFPTPHEGGVLKLRAAGREEGETMEWTFDPTALLAQQAQPSIAYVAFFSDVEHEVMPVTSGHRVTITYNLYYALNEPEPSTFPNQISTNERSFKDALQTILQDELFLPQGGNLMFGLRHQYPLATSTESGRVPARYRDRLAAKAQAREVAKASLRALDGRLKATDGVMLRVLRECALDASLRVLYEARHDQWSREMGYVMADSVLPLPHMSQMIEESAVEYLCAQGGELVQDAVVLMARRAARRKARAKAKSKSHEDEDGNEDEGEYEDKDMDEDEDADEAADDGEDDDDDEDYDDYIYDMASIYERGAKAVYWVTDPPFVRSGKGSEKTVQTYGNEPALDAVYWRIWIFVRVGPAGQRETANI